MSKPKAPPAVDYAALAAQQGQNSKDTAQYNAQLNRVNQIDPHGASVTWSSTPGASGPQRGTAANGATFNEQAYLEANPDVARSGMSGAEHYARYGRAEGRQAIYNDVQGSGDPTWTQTTSYSPEQQKLYQTGLGISQSLANTANSSLDRVSQAMGQSFDMSGLPQRQGVNANPGTSAEATLPYSSVDQSINTGLSPLATGFGGATPYQAFQGSAPVERGAPIASGNVTTSLNTSGVRKLPGTIDDASRKRVEEAIMSRVNPMYEKDEQALRTRLLNSGIEVGTDAYNREIGNFGQRFNDARMQAVLVGGQEESRQVGLTAGLNAQEFAQALASGQFAQTGESINARNNLEASRYNSDRTFEASKFDTQQKIADYLTQMQGGQQDFNQRRDAASFGNAATQQNFQNSLGLDQARNTAEMGKAAFANTAAGDQTQRQLMIDQITNSMQLQNAGFNNTSRQQDIQEQAYLRQLPLNELNALMSGAQTTSPQFQSYYTGASAQGAPIFDAGIAQGNAAQQAYQQQMQGYNGLLGGLAKLGGSAIAASDIRLKTNIVRIGDHPAGVGLYSWDWKDGSGSSSGVLAQELQAVRPEAVSRMANGFLGVNYDMIGGF